MKIHVLLVLVSLLWMGTPAFAQDKPSCTTKRAGKSCSPDELKKACGPGNTKVAEAAIVTDLRTQFIALYNKVYSEKSASDQEWYGKDEEESLALLENGLKGIRKDTGLEVKDYSRKNKARRIKALSEDISFVTEQVATADE